MRLKVLVFGPLADAAGGRVLEVGVVESKGLDAAGVLGLIGEAYPMLRGMLASARLAINSKFAGPGDTVAEGDELALIGMVSGG